MANFSYGKRMLRKSIINHMSASGSEVYHKRRFKDDEFYCKSGLDQEGFEKKYISNYIGYGIFTTRNFQRGDFLLEYVGERIHKDEAVKREKKRKNRMSYMFFFKFNENTHCVDASKTEDRLCHLVNDAPSKSKECNAKMKLKVFPNIHMQYPRLCLYALRDIAKGEEIKYDYGDDEENMEWRKKEKTVVPIEEETDEDPFDLDKDFELDIENTNATSSGPESSYYPQPEPCLDPPPEFYVDPQAELGLDAQPESCLDPQPESRIDPHPESCLDPTPKFCLYSLPESCLNPVSEWCIDPQPESCLDPQPESGLDSLPESGLDSLPESGLDSLPESGLDLQPESCLDTQPESCLDQQPESHLDLLPESGLDSLPESGLDSLPESGLDSLPESGLDSLPESGLDLQPESCLDTQPESCLDQQPESHLDLLPESGLDSLPESGLDLQPESCLDTQPESCLDQQPESHLDLLPESGLDSLPESGLDSLPESGLDSLPESGLDSLPESGLDLQPESCLDTQPESCLDQQPESHLDLLPESGLDSLPESGLDLQPESCLDTQPESCLDQQPESHLDLLPESGLDSLPESGLDSLPESGLDSLPESGLDSLPESGLDSLPESGLDSLPESGLDSLPESCLDTQPESCLDSLPESGLDSLPESHLDSLPESGLDSLPESGLDSLPESGLDSLPESCLDTQPESCLDSLPESGLDSLPESHLDSLPESGLDSLPELGLDQQPESRLDPQPESCLDQQPESHLDSHPESCLDPLPESSLDQQPESHLDSLPESGLDQQPESCLDPQPESCLDQQPESCLDSHPESCVEPQLESCLYSQPESCLDPHPESFLAPQPESGLDQQPESCSDLQPDSEQSDNEDTYSDIFPALTTRKKADKYLIDMPISQETAKFVLCPITGQFIQPSGELEKQIYEKEPAKLVLCPITGQFIEPSGEEQIYEKETSDIPFSDEELSYSEKKSYRLSRSKVKVKRIHKVDGKRQYDKLLACYFCGKLFRHRIQKHLKSCHSNETMVASACSKSLKSERKKLFDRIMNYGSFKHNMQVLMEGHGNLIVKRRPSKETLTSVDYLPCINCYGFFGKKELWRHSKKCKFNKHQSEVQEGIIARSKLLLAGGLCPYLEEKESVVPKELEETVFKKMRKDEVYDCIVGDSLTLQFGKFMINQLGSRRTNYVSQRMRQLGRLKMKLNGNSNEEKDLQSMITPEHFDEIITAVKYLAGYHRNEQQIAAFKTPSLALNLGHNLVKVAEIKRGNGIRMSDDVMKKESDDFLMLHSSDWTQMISSVALATLRTNKFNKPTALPVTSDLILLKTYLDSIIEEVSRHTFQQQDLKLWKKLAEATLTRITLFNKRRSSEVAKLLSTSFKNRCNWQQCVNKEISKGLKPMEKMLLKRLQMVETQGKQNKKCPVLLTPAMVKAIDCLEAQKKICGVSLSNPFVFASPSSSDNPLNAWAAMNKMAHEAGCENPQLISSSRLRKYLATVCQVLDLEDFELEWLSRHLAHNINTHKNHYRQHDSTIEITKIGSLIMAADEGQLGKFAGKKLSDIDVSEITISLDNDMNDEDDCVHPAKDEDVLDIDLSDEIPVGNYMNMPKEHNNAANHVQLKPETRTSKKRACTKERKNKDFEVAIDESGDDADDDHDYHPGEEDESEEYDESGEDEDSAKMKTIPIERKKTERKKWTIEEKKILEVEFNKFIKSKMIPRNNDALMVKQKHSILSDRSIHQIKSKVQHLIRSK